MIDSLDINVCAICKNEGVLIRPWVNHLLDIDYISKVIVVDTGSTDDTLNNLAGIDDSRLKYYRFNWNKDFAAARNYALSKVNDDCTWIMILDVDELFSDEYHILFDMLYDDDLSNIDIVKFPHIKFYDWDKLWFHVPPITPNMKKDGSIEYTTHAIAGMYRKDIIQYFEGSLHERLKLFKENPTMKLASMKRTTNLSGLNDLKNDVFVCHYSKAKLHEEARRLGHSFEYRVGLKRMRFRDIKPVNYFGRLYDKHWVENATKEDIEQLGKDQMRQFIEVHGHTFPNFNAFDLNNEFIKKEFLV